MTRHKTSGPHSALYCGLGQFLGVLLALLSAVTCSAQTWPAGVSLHGSGGINTPHQQSKPYLILISIDGFRWDYMDRYPTPNMHRIAAAGSKAERLLPVFPTLTFPNHYSIATGLYPARHGLARRLPAAPLPHLPHGGGHPVRLRAEAGQAGRRTGPRGVGRPGPLTLEVTP